MPQQDNRHLIKKLLASKIFLLFVALILIWLGVSVVRESYRKYQLTQEINQIKSEIERLEGNNQDLANLIEYFQQESFLEKEARLKLNLKKPGEKVVIVPKGEEEVGSLTPNEWGVKLPTEEEIQKEEPNWLKWWRYFFGRQ